MLADIDAVRGIFWVEKNNRVETWKAYALDVAPENPAYEWQPGDFKVPTGRGAAGS